jgi:hypothetical protein
MVSRRLVLGGAVAVAALGVPLIGSARNSKASAAGGLPLTVVNNTGQYPNDAISVYIVGTNLASGQQAYIARDGSLNAVSASLNGPDGFADLAIPLSASGSTAVSLPADMSGRIYVAINDKLRFKVVTDGAGNAALQYPAGWVASDPSYQVLHDFVEFTHNGAGMFTNTTAVDQFSIPLALRLDGADSQTTGTLSPGGRANIFAAMTALPDFTGLIVGNNLRVIAPGHGIDSGVFPASYYDSYINDVWGRYASTALTVTTDSGARTGRVSGDVLTFDGGVAPIRRPSTRDVFYCDGALAAPNDGVTGPVAAVLGAAFNRSTLLDQASQPVTDPARFYQPAVTNHYSRAIHQNMADGKAYGFAFDDVNSFASYIQDTAPSSLTLTLTPFA